MPTYVYRREDGTTFEIEQRITEPSLKRCPTTDQPVKRLITSGAGLVFKGSGFYITDYARAGSNGQANKKPGSTSSDASSDKSDTKKSGEPTKSQKSDSGNSSTSEPSGKGDK